MDKFKLVDKISIPPSRRRRPEDYDKFFDSIPKGKAVFIPESKQNNIIENALRRRQKKGDFLHLQIWYRGDNCYIVHSSEESKDA